jgi:hypothetical protein
LPPLEHDDPLALTPAARVVRSCFWAAQYWEVLVRYKVKNTAALHLALGGLPDRMRVDADPGIGVSARTVGDLRKATIWPENLAITTPLDGHHAVVVSKVSTKRATPKP